MPVDSTSLDGISPATILQNRQSAINSTLASARRAARTRRRTNWSPPSPAGPPTNGPPRPRPSGPGSGRSASRQAPRPPGRGSWSIWPSRATAVTAVVAGQRRRGRIVGVGRDFCVLESEPRPHGPGPLAGDIGGAAGAGGQPRPSGGRSGRRHRPAPDHGPGLAGRRPPPGRSRYRGGARIDRDPRRLPARTCSRCEPTHRAGAWPMCRSACTCCADLRRLR